MKYVKNQVLNPDTQAADTPQPPVKIIPEAVFEQLRTLQEGRRRRVGGGVRPSLFGQEHAKKGQEHAKNEGLTPNESA